MSSPSIESPISDPNLCKTHISPTHHRHTLLPKPSSCKIALGRPKHGTKSDRSMAPELNLRADHNIYACGHSPYYKGLTDQSLAIYKRVQLTSSDDQDQGSCPGTQSQCHPFSNNYTLSPYYKGLTDQSLAIDGSVLESNGSWRTLQSHLGSSPPSAGVSPYYQGLLPLDGPHLASDSLSSFGFQSHTSGSSHPSILSLNWGLRLKSKEEFDQKAAAATGLNPEQSSWSPKCKTDLNVQKFEKNETSYDIGSVVDHEEKPLRERVSEADELGKVNTEEIEDKTPLDKMDSENTKENISDCGLASDEKEKPLRERISVSEQEVALASESTCKDGNVTEKGNVREYVWASKYQPQSLVAFICNKDKALHLQDLVKGGCGCNHFIFEGPPGVGKRSMIRAMIREVFGPLEITEEYKSFNLKGEMIGSIEVRIKKSRHHVEVNLSETKGYEKHVIVDLFKDTYGKIFNEIPCSPDNCQAIILYESEKLSTESLLYIRWLLERYKGCNKVFFCCSEESKLQPVKPLCTTIRLLAPSTKEITNVLEFIAEKEGIELSHEFAMKIIEKSKNNLRQAIRSFEATWRNQHALNDDQLILTGWEEDISTIAKDIIEEQSPKQLYIVRKKLQSLMVHNVDPDFIYKTLVADLMALVDESLRAGVPKLDKEYNKGDELKLESMKQVGVAQNKQGELDDKNNDIIKKNSLSYLKVEEFIAKFMSWYKSSSGKSYKHVQLDTTT